MSQLSSIEISRAVIMPANSYFEEDVTSIARDLFDTEGHGLVSVRPSNVTFRTIRPGMLIVPESELRLYHLSRTGDNVKHFGKKVMVVREKLEEGPQLKIESVEGACAEIMAGREPLADTLARVMAREYGMHPEKYGTIPVTLNKIEAVKYPAKYPLETIFTLGIRAEGDTPLEHLVHRMSDITQLALKHVDDNGRVYNAEGAGFANRVPFARTRSTDFASLNSFERTVAELLPLHVQLGSIDLRAEF